MEKYELAIVLPGSATSAKKKASTEKLTKLAGVLKVKIGKIDDWGKLDLQYEIKGQDTGVFLLYDLELEPSQVKALNDKLRLDEGIIRYLLVKKNG